ncbi:Chorismate mutase domain protein [mine drainage metagenome]|uniref:Chorismate mutase domain protein n=1 Tax=mine drainage metagenome TaxID=410659 RepID=T0ZAG0_9ZZZZ
MVDGSRPPADLESFRRALERLDREMLTLYSRRRQLVRDLWEHKRGRGLPLRDRAQEHRVLERARKAAGSERIPPAEAEAFMRWLLLACRRAARSPSRWVGKAGKDPGDRGSPSRGAPLSRRDPLPLMEGSYAPFASDGHAGPGPGRKAGARPRGTDP